MGSGACSPSGSRATPLSVGLIALLDDVAGLAKVAAASLDDAATQTLQAGTKAVGVVIDDAAVTPRYVVGFDASRELPIIGKIAIGSVKNKLLYLLPAALGLSLAAPWAIRPLLMLGGAYLCYEGVEKIYRAIRPHPAHDHETAPDSPDQDARSFEDEKVRSAIKTDFILSAEIMAITLASVPDASPWLQAVVLALVGLGITALVYGGVALIVKADDAGVALARNARPFSSLAGFLRPAASGAPASLADRLLRPLTRGFGHGLVIGMPVFLRVLGIIGTAAMIWVGGGIILHGLEAYGLTTLRHAMHGVAEAARHAVPALAAAAAWAATATVSGIFGLLVGATVMPLVERVGVPAAMWLRRGKDTRR